MTPGMLIRDKYEKMKVLTVVLWAASNRRRSCFTALARGDHQTYIDRGWNGVDPNNPRVE